MKRPKMIFLEKIGGYSPLERAAFANKIKKQNSKLKIRISHQEVFLKITVQQLHQNSPKNHI